MHRTTRRLLLWVTAFWAGSTVMAFELLATRLLMPQFGMGIDVWAAVIGGAMAFLAVGCFLGGKIADCYPSLRALAATLLLGGAALLAARWLGHGTAWLLSALPVTPATWCSAALVLASPLLILGVLEPLLARLMIDDPRRSGTVVGRLLAAVTIGSVLGTLLTALVLVPRVGVARSLTALGCGTCALGVSALLCERQWRTAAVAAMAAAVLTIWAWPRPTPPEAGGPERVLRIVEGRYGVLEVIEMPNCLAISCNGIVQTAVPRSGVGFAPGTLLRGRDYTELLPYFRPHARTAVVIGLGGGLHAQALAGHGLEVQGVEIEPAMAALATEFFGLAAEVTIGDGRAWLARSERRFDAIILDAFLGGTPAEHLHTREAFARMADHLEPGGVVVVHLIARPRHAATAAVARTLSAVFPHLTAVRSGLGDELQHIYLFAGREPCELTLERRGELATFGFTGEEIFEVDWHMGVLLTDDCACLTLLSRELAVQCRRSRRTNQ